MSKEKHYDIEKSFSDTIKNSELLDASFEITEVGLDRFLEEGIVRELPVVKTIYALMQSGIAIHDRLFIKKLISFLIRIDEVSPEKRKKMIALVDNSKKYRIKVGEKLLYILDRCNDYEVAELVGELFKAYLTSNITYDQYILASEAVSNMPVATIKGFIIGYDTEKGWRSIEDVSGYIHSGLYDINYEEPNVVIRENDDYKALREGSANQYVADVQDGGMWATPSELGGVIWSALGGLYREE
ncbi:hypothetical protein I8H83_01680 [Candidatus Saccharibacteria bacterium]|nr:hypothetical protein [Candidatus Saccharibacteria bacterium]